MFFFGLYAANVDPFCSSHFHPVAIVSDFVQFRMKQRVYYKLVMKTHYVSCCLMWHQPWTPLQILQVALVFFQGIFRKKTLVKDPSKILATNCSFVFWGGSHRLTKLDCYDLLLHDVTEDKKKRFQRVYSGPQGLALCSGNSDRDEKDRDRDRDRNRDREREVLNLDSPVWSFCSFYLFLAGPPILMKNGCNRLRRWSFETQNITITEIRRSFWGDNN